MFSWLPRAVEIYGCFEQFRSQVCERWSFIGCTRRLAARASTSHEAMCPTEKSGR
jgi:hypothetical protein